MDLKAIAERLDFERRTLPSGACRLEQLARVTRQSAPSGAWHTIVWSNLTAATAEEEIGAQLAYFRDLGAELEWKVYRHDRPADLLERLATQGFEVGPCEAVMVFDLNDLPDWVKRVPDASIVRVAHRDQLEQFRAVAQAVSGKPNDGTIDELAAAINSAAPPVVGYLALAEGKPVGIGRLYTHPESHFGGLYGGGILVGYRHQGLYRALVAGRAQDARRRGARYLLVDALPTSRPILQRLGFAHLTDTWPCLARPDRKELFHDRT